ncbi:protein eva-1 homolog A isoform X2 [Betta splendens]|uniref:Protein eva-1 homolog A isoform X2 n=1 Tax=Betta splendens TaxID=158456 RepID=A0A6P7M1Y6_BETSP|nr:protein eva-1 homolog A isoform X2 [Betta splendens]
MSAPTTGSPTVEAKVEMALLSNMLAAYTFIADRPERTALVFLGSVCVGLLVTLAAIVFQIHCRADCHYGNTDKPGRRHGNRQHPRRPRGCPHHGPGDGNPGGAAAAAAAGAAPGGGDSDAEEWDETSDLSARRRRRFERALLHATMFTSAEELDRAQRLEERERVLREIWMNGQPDISTVTQSLNRYY